MIRAAILAAVVLAHAVPVAAERVEVPVAAFKFSGKGHYVWKLDRRDLFQIIHPWTTSKAGDFGQMEAEVAIPAAAKAPFTLAFYVMDNNYAGPANTGADWINRDVRAAHRFRQALVNGQIVWQQDTSLDDVSQHHLVDISDKVKPGTTLKLAFRLWEAVDSGVSLPGDVYLTEHYATKVATAVRQVIKDRYETKSYWGDVAIYSGSRPKLEEIPWGGQISVRPFVPAPALAPAPGKVVLGLERAESLNGPWPWPVCQGIPLDSGAVKEPASLALFGPDGSRVTAEWTKLNSWPDGSVQWASACFTLRPKAAGPFELRQDRAASAAPIQPANPVVSHNDLSARNGLVGISWPENATNSPLAVLAGDGRCVSAGPISYLHASGKRFAAKWSARRWLLRSAQMAEIEATGDVVAEGGERFGACRARAAMFAGCPYVRWMFTVVNQRPEKTFSTEAWGLRLPIPECQRHAAGPGWVSVRSKGACLTAAVRWFAHLWPNGIEATPEGIDFQFFKPGDPRMPACATHPGEAKTQEIWLAVTPEAPSEDDCKRLAALVDSPPRLDTSGLIRDSRVWGDLPKITSHDHKDVYAKVEQSLSPYFQNCKQNVRQFGEYSNWDNF